MRESELLRIYRPLYEYLDGLNIYGVRNLARAFGVNAPTSEKKHELIVRLIGVASGIVAPEPRSNKGARVKSAEVPPENIEQVRRLLAECKETMPFLAGPDSAEKAEFHDSAADRRSSGGYADRRCIGILECLGAGGRLCTKDGARTDVFVAQSCIDEYRLREGDLISGYAGERREGGAEVVQVIGVGGLAPSATRALFEDFSAQFPAERISLSSSACAPMRAADLLCPIGKGQRVLFRAPAAGGKTSFIREMAHCAALADLRTVILAFGRPEECSELSAAVPSASVFAAPFGALPAERLRAARLALAYCKRIAEAGGDAVLLLDSLAELVRACAAEADYHGERRAEVLSFAERLFASARRLKGAGSLTVVASAPSEDGSIDRFADAANSLLYGSAEWIAPGEGFGIDFARSSTQRADMLLNDAERASAASLRAQIAQNGASGMAAVLQSMKKENL